MKIFKDNSVYVQKNDMVYLNQTDIPIPASIFMKVFGNGITIIDERNRYEFVKFEAPEEVEFFQNQDWIVDYNEIKNLINKHKIEEINISKYDLESNTIKEILDDANTVSLFSSKKLIIVENSFIFSRTTKKIDDIDKLEDYLKNSNPDVVILFVNYNRDGCSLADITI